MSLTQQDKHVIKLDLPAKNPGVRRAARFATAMAESILALDQLNELYGECSRGNPGYREFSHRCLEWIRCRWRPNAEDLARILEPFEHAGRGEGSQHSKGAGLGLTLVKAFAELHGGRLELSSTPGAGLRATVTLPAAAQTGEPSIS